MFLISLSIFVGFSMNFEEVKKCIWMCSCAGGDDDFMLMSGLFVVFVDLLARRRTESDSESGLFDSILGGSISISEESVESERLETNFLFLNSLLVIVSIKRFLRAIFDGRASREK